MIKYVVRAENVREMMAHLKEIDPKLVTQFRKELKATAAGLASEIQSQINMLPVPLSNMQYGSGRALRWAGAKATVSFSMSRTKKRNVSYLLGVKVDSPKGSPGYIVAEKAGSNGPVGLTGLGGRSAWGGSDRGGPQGSNVIAVMTERFGRLKGKGGNRIAWGLFYKKRHKVERDALAVLDKYGVELTEMVNR